MEQRIVLQDEHQYIYFIQDSGIGFYMMIPRSTNVGIILEMIPSVDDVKIKSIVHPNDKVVIAPVIGSNYYESIGQNSMEGFQSTDELFSKVINLAYQILTYNHLDVDNIIYMDENTDYVGFQRWFIKKYEGRVVLVRMTPVVDQTVSHPPIVEKEPTAMNDTPVVESSFEEDREVNTISDDRSKDMGFVSYVLLGVVVAVISLVLLYFLV